MYELRQGNFNRYTAIAYDICLVDDKMQRHSVEKVENVLLEEAASFLSSRGCYTDEVEHAVEEMEKNEHNWACFGVLGTFIFSKYNGVLN